MDQAHDRDDSAGSGQPLRFELVPVAPTTTGWIQRRPTPPPLVLDVGVDGEVRVAHATTNELIASAGPAYVRARPGKYQYLRLESTGGTQPLLILDIPGAQQLRLGAPRMESSWGDDNYRYVWGRWVEDEMQPTHEVTEPAWLSLVERFGLGTLVVDEDASGRIEQRNHFGKLKIVVEVVLVLFLIAMAVYAHFAR